MMATTQKKQTGTKKETKTVYLQQRAKAAPAKRKKAKKSARSKKSGKNFSWVLLLIKLALIVIFVLAGYVAYCWFTMPDIAKAVAQTRQPSTVIMAENGNDIAKFGQVYDKVIYPDKLPKNLTNAIIATEDRRFYQHFGFDIIGFTRAMLTNVFRKRYAQGASTITQQVAKNVFLTPNKTIKRKVQELLLSFWLENKFSKNQIMALYLNRVYFGSGNYGAEAAARWYFNKSVYDLNVREAAILAGMLKAPNRYNPILQRKRALERADTVLALMKKSDFLTEKQYAQAKNLPVNNGQNYRVSGGKHFAQYVYDEVNNYIGERASDIAVMTTLNQKLQENAEQILRKHILANKDKNVHEGAVVIMDKTGAVKAMVGGIDYNKSQFNRAVQAKRQSGSAFKPFVYLTALQYGFTPESKVKDAPITIGKWKPENYTKKYYGEVTLDYALANSLNVATVALSRELYLKDIANNAKNMGISTKIDTSPSMVLGTNAVKLIDMATAYAVMANGGKSVVAHTINEISTTDGRQLYLRPEFAEKQIIQPQAVREITSMLEHVINRGTGQKAKLPIFAAGKTGTSQNFRDAWFIGWTNKYICAVWVGNDNEKPMNKVGGGSLPAQIWHDIMATTIGETPQSSGNTAAPDDEIGNLIENETDDEIGALIDEQSADDTDEIGELIGRQ